MSCFYSSSVTDTRSLSNADCPVVIIIYNDIRLRVMWKLELIPANFGQEAGFHPVQVTNLSNTYTETNKRSHSHSPMGDLEELADLICMSLKETHTVTRRTCTQLRQYIIHNKVLLKSLDTHSFVQILFYIFISLILNCQSSPKTCQISKHHISIWKMFRKSVQKDKITY